MWIHLLALELIDGAGGDVTPPQEPGYTGEVDVSRWYVKRGKKLHIFANSREADAFLEAERQAQEAIERAQLTSRQARRRAKKRVYEAVAHETVDIDLLGKLADQYALGIDLPALIAAQDYMEIVRLSLLAQEMQEEDDIETLLLGML